MFTALLFIVIFSLLCSLKTDYCDRHAPKLITPDLLLSSNGKALSGASRQARIAKLVREGYVMP